MNVIAKPKKNLFRVSRLKAHVSYPSNAKIIHAFLRPLFIVDLGWEYVKQQYQYTPSVIDK